MAFIKNEKLEDLQRKAEKLGYYKKQEEEARKRDRISELTRDLKKAERDYDQWRGVFLEEKAIEIHNLKREQNREVRKLNNDIEDYKIDLKNRTEDVDYYKNEYESVKKENSALLKKARDVELQREELDAQKALHKAREKVFGKMENVLKDEKVKTDARVEEARETGYKNGYADGMADGLRKGADVNLHKDSKELLEKVVMVSLAKEHGDSFKDELADIAKNAFADITLAKVSNSPEKKSK